jgi:UDP-N-acetylmuramate dehydrogenase
VVLGGGSNVVVPDRGIAGVVLHPDLCGITSTETEEGILLTAGAGEAWDDLVRYSVDHGWAGIECLSGIPGSVGATPIQNVGAYGQEVRETIRTVETIHRQSMRPEVIPGSACDFGYRRSRFKDRDAGHFIITSVQFLLRKDGVPTLRYPELQRAFDAQHGPAVERSGPAALSAVRDTVLALRRSKSMLVDPADPESRSAGSFFLNPVLDPAAFSVFADAARRLGADPPTFPAPGGTKIPAAWLVERAGFPRGTRRGGVGISRHHALALVNYSGTTDELLSLAEAIREAVRAMFGICLTLEPVILE